jgi:hypothetical protein
MKVNTCALKFQGIGIGGKKSHEAPFSDSSTFGVVAVFTSSIHHGRNTVFAYCTIYSAEMPRYFGEQNAAIPY